MKSDISVRPLMFSRRFEAEEVLEQLTDCLQKYNHVSVFDLYEYMGYDNDISNDKYGWKNLKQAYIQFTYGGYVLFLPKPERLS